MAFLFISSAPLLFFAILYLAVALFGSPPPIFSGFALSWSTIGPWAPFGHTWLALRLPSSLPSGVHFFVLLVCKKACVAPGHAFSEGPCLQ